MQEALINQKPVRVLIANDHIGYEESGLHGVGRLLIEWSKGFDRRRVEPTTCILRKVLQERVTPDNVPIIFFGHGRLNPLTILKFVSLIKQRRIDVLHLQGFGATLFGRIAGLITKTPAIVHMHSYSEIPGYRVFGRTLDRVLSRSTALALAVSKPVKTFCIEEMGFNPEQVELVRNPAPEFGFTAIPIERVQALREQYGLNPDTPVVGTTCRLSAEKGIHVLMQAFELVLKALPQTKLLIVGDGPERKKLEAQAKGLGICQSVIFVGFQRDVAAYLQLFWITAAPSICEETSCLSAIESVAAGVPVVASRVGGVGESIADGEMGFLVQKGRPMDLADAILRVLRDSALRKRLAENCTSRRELFSMQRHLELLEALYRKAVSAAV